MKYTVDNRGIVKLIGEQENLYMAKYSGQLSYKGLLSVEDNQIFITESKKDTAKKEIVEEKFNITEKLREFEGKNASVTVKEDKDLEPIED